MPRTRTFEATYTDYPFAPLVTLGIALAAWFKSADGKVAGVADAEAQHDHDSGNAIGHAA